MAESLTEEGALTMMLRREEERLLARREAIERELASSERRLEHIRALLGGEAPAAGAHLERSATGNLRTVA